MYDDQLTRWAHLINIKSPYTLVKSVYYMETASLFLFLTQKIIKSPNFITFLYALTGVIGAFLLHSSQETLFYIGIFMVFTKGTFDWADGPLARRLNKTSFLGHALDTYGAFVSDSAFRIAFVYYTLRYYPELMSWFPIIAFVLLITKFNLFSGFMYYQKNTLHPSSKLNKIRKSENEDSFKRSHKKSEWYYRYTAILDSRSRSIDSLLLILLIDTIFDYDLTILLLTLSALILIRAIVIYMAGVYFAMNVYNKDL
ncbi:MAG: CDP-alcohol phosphatidyltransferase family protein [Gammaproteobacteria bacterium]|nr:CDP-alcohol phosphatidyltransferase family protein [Gammaproteobacteria bacterium]